MQDSDANMPESAARAAVIARVLIEHFHDRALEVALIQADAGVDGVRATWNEIASYISAADPVLGAD